MKKFTIGAAIRAIFAGTMIVAATTGSAQSTAELEKNEGSGEASSYLVPNKFEPKQLAAKLENIKSYVTSGQTGKALALADQMVKSNPENRQVWIIRAALRIRLGWQTDTQWDAWYGLALQEQTYSYLQLGVSFTRLERFEKAREMFSYSKIFEDNETRKLRLNATGTLDLAEAKIPKPPGESVLQEGRSAYGDRNYDRAFVLFLKAAEANNPTSMGNVAHMYSQGLGTKVDKDRAAHWFKKGAENGAREAMYRYSGILKDGIGVPHQDRGAALHWLKRSAEYGYDEAIFEMGSNYKWGDGVAKDPELAVAHFRAAAEQYHGKALYFLGRMFDTGEGIQHNAARAAESVVEAINQNNEFAILQLTQFHHRWSRDFRRKVQVNLRELGLFNGVEDGNFGDDTIEAIKALASDE